MRKLAIVIAVIFCSFSAFSQTIPSYSARRLMERASNKDTLYIINFWATWCVPCVHELPSFDTLQKKYAGKPVKIILASFDFKESYPVKLAAFIKKKHLTPEVVWFNETNADIFIPEIDNSWSGSLPATLIIQPAKQFKKIMEGTITVWQVSDIVDRQLSLNQK